MHGRPHAITISDTTESVIEGLRFVQSQMWTMTVARSERVLLQDIYVNSTSGPGRDFRSIVNTDGVDVGSCIVISQSKRTLLMSGCRRYMPTISRSYAGSSAMETTR